MQRNLNGLSMFGLDGCFMSEILAMSCKFPEISVGFEIATTCTYISRDFGRSLN